MNNLIERYNLRPVFILGWIILFVCSTSIFTMLAVPSYLLKAILAIILLTLAAAFPIRQRRINLFPILLLIAGILFLISGIVENAYNTVVRPLPTDSKIEFSRVLSPQHISRGLWNIGVGILYLLPSAVGLFLVKISPRKWLSLIMCILSLLFIFFGASSIVDGLNGLH